MSLPHFDYVFEDFFVILCLKQSIQILSHLYLFQEKVATVSTRQIYSNVARNLELTTRKIKGDENGRRSLIRIQHSVSTSEKCFEIKNLIS